MKMTCLEFRKKNENDFSSVQDQKKNKMICLEFKAKKKEKMKMSCLEVKTNKNKGKFLRSRLKILRNFRIKNAFY